MTRPDNVEAMQALRQQLAYKNGMKGGLIAAWCDPRKVRGTFQVAPTTYFLHQRWAPSAVSWWFLGLRHVSEAQAEFKNRQTGVAFTIELADLKEIRIPDYFILNCDITVRAGTATLVSRKSSEEEFVKRRKPAEDL